MAMLLPEPDNPETRMTCISSSPVDRGLLALDELLDRIDAAALEDVVAHRHLDQHRKVAAGRNRDAHLGDGDAEEGLGRRHHVEPVEPDFADFLRVHQLDDELEVLLRLDGRFAEQEADVEDAQPAHLEEVADQRGAVAFQRIRRDVLQFDHVVGDQAVAARDQLECQLALADAGVALDEHADAEHFEEHAVDRSDLGQALGQVVP